MTNEVQSNLADKERLVAVAATALLDSAAEEPFDRVPCMSGYTEEEITARAGGTSGLNFLEKPFSPDRRSSRVREVLDA